MQITAEFLQQQKQHLETERARAIAFVGNADGALSMIAALLERLQKTEEPETP